MPIVWDTWKITVRNYFDSNSAVKDEVTANFLALQYTSAVLQGGDVLAGNVVIVQPTMTKALEAAFVTAFSNGLGLTDIVQSPLTFGTDISTGLINFWTSAQLAPVLPPPGSTAVVPPNPVTVPGVPIPRLEVGYDIDFTDSLVDFFTQHLSTLQGITVGLVPGTPPVPTPFPWTGYQ